MTKRPYGLTTAQVEWVLQGEKMGKRHVIMVPNENRRKQLLKQFPALKPHHVVLPPSERPRTKQIVINVFYLDEVGFHKL